MMDLLMVEGFSPGIRALLYLDSARVKKPGGNLYKTGSQTPSGFWEAVISR